MTPTELAQPPSDTPKEPPSRAYVNGLPIELLGDIASILATLDPHSIWTFASICHYWRAAALCTPTCWARIHIKDTQLDFTRIRDPKTTLWLSRAKQSELEIRLDGGAAPLLKAEPLSSISLSRIGSLHLGSWDPKLVEWLSWGPLNFDALKVLSISGRCGVMNRRVNLSSIVATFIAQEDKDKETHSISAPHLEELALKDVFIDIATFPKLSTLRSLKLLNCDTDRSISYLSLLAQAKNHLTTLSLINITQDWSGYRVSTPLALRELELPLVTSITLLGIETRLPEPQAFITSLRCPAAKRLTCDDKSLGYLLNPAFPSLTHLFVNLTSRANTPPYERVLSRLRPLFLTIYRPSCHDRHGLQSLVWSATHVPGMASTLKGMRFISIREKVVMDTLLGALNAARRTKPDIREGNLFAKNLVMAEAELGKDVPWGKFFAETQS
jgi:hypothetical protein